MGKMQKCRPPLLTIYQKAPWFAGIAAVAVVGLSLRYHPPVIPVLVMFAGGLTGACLFILGDLSGRTWLKGALLSVPVLCSIEINHDFPANTSDGIYWARLSWMCLGMQVPFILAYKRGMALHQGAVPSSVPAQEQDEPEG